MNTKTKSKPTFSKGWLIGLVLGITTALGVLAYAAVTIPHTFTSGTTISSTQMNENFQAIADNLSGADQNVTVTCGAGTIAAALAKAAPAGRLIITVSGTCTEDVIIERDHVTLKDGTIAGTGAVQPVIQILGARGIVIDNMTVQGGASHGIFATRNADVTITNSTVRNNAEDGVQLRWGAFADISGSMIMNNTNCAVSPRDGANVLLTNNPLITTAQPVPATCSTIGAYRGTTVRLAGGNTITNTGPAGALAMDIAQGSTVRAQSGTDTIVGGVTAGRLVDMDLRNVDINGDVAVFHGSWLRLRAPSMVTGDIFISPDSSAQLSNSPTIDGTVTCGNSGGFLEDNVTANTIIVNPSGLLARPHEGLVGIQGTAATPTGGFVNCNF